MLPGYAKIPCYVLKNGLHPACPAVAKESLKQTAKVIFGFSDKPEYDAFLNDNSQALTPYPLVKGYLQNQIASDTDALKLIVLDAMSPKQLVLRAAEMQAVLEAAQLGSNDVAVTHELTFDETSKEYHLAIRNKNR